MRIKKSFEFPSILLTENNFLRTSFRGPFFRGRIFRGPFFRGPFFPGTIFPEPFFLGTIFPGDHFSRDHPNLFAYGSTILDPSHFNPLDPDGSYMGPWVLWKKQLWYFEAKGLVGNANFLFIKKLIGRLNADRPLLIYQLWPFGSNAIVSSISPWIIYDPFGPKGLNVWICNSNA